MVCNVCNVWYVMYVMYGMYVCMYVCMYNYMIMYNVYDIYVCIGFDGVKSLLRSEIFRIRCTHMALFAKPLLFTELCFLLAMRVYRGVPEPESMRVPKFHPVI